MTASRRTKLSATGATRPCCTSTLPLAGRCAASLSSGHGHTLRPWQHTYLGYFTTERFSNGGTESINGIIELHRRIARGYRNGHRHGYRLRRLLVTGGLDPYPHRKSDEPSCDDHIDAVVFDGLDLSVRYLGVDDDVGELGDVAQPV